MWQSLDGWKTVITAGIAALTGAVALLGYMTESTAMEVQTLLVPLALVFMRMGIQKAQDAATE